MSKSSPPLHVPVLLDHVLEILHPHPGSIIVDCTVGLGGHASELLKRIGKKGRLIGIDFDPASLERARVRLAEVGPNFILHRGNFAGLPQALAVAGAGRADAVLADLGVSSPQIDDAARGFSYLRDGPLDMRMDPTRGRTAADLVNTMKEEELAEALADLGDETDAPAIARHVAERRKRAPIRTTRELAELVCAARRFTWERALGAKLHPAARTFQALRILVNRELASLERLLTVLPAGLAPGGVAAIISFHSGEDRRVKAAFRDGLRAGFYSEISPDPIVADDEERGRNPRSRPAKMRWARASRTHES